MVILPKVVVMAKRTCEGQPGTCRIPTQDVGSLVSTALARLNLFSALMSAPPSVERAGSALAFSRYTEHSALVSESLIPRLERLPL